MNRKTVLGVAIGILTVGAIIYHKMYGKTYAQVTGNYSISERGGVSDKNIR